MKKTILLLTTLMMLITLVAGCSQKQPDDQGGNTPEKTGETVLIQINVEGIAEIAATDDGSEPKFDDEYPFSSYVTNTEKGKTIKASTRTTDADYQFIKWTKNGEFFSNDTSITITADADAEYIAVYGMRSGYEGTPITDIKDAKTLGDVFALPYKQAGYDSEKYFYVFELNNIIYRVEAALTPEIVEQIQNLDWDDPEHNLKEMNLVAPLALTRVDNLTALIPTQDKLTKYIGMNGQDMVDQNWFIQGYEYEPLKFNMNHGMFAYEVYFDGEIDPATFNDETDMGKLTVKDIKCVGIGDAFDFIPEE